MARQGTAAPSWFATLAGELAELCAPTVAIRHLTRIERAISSSSPAPTPSAVLDALGADRRLRDTKTLTTEFFVRHGYCLADDPAIRIQAWRERRLRSLPSRLQPGAGSFIDHLQRGQRRAQLYGNRGLCDRTINNRLAVLAQLGNHLTARGVIDWSGVTAADVETFLAQDVGGKLATVRAFFAFAKQRRLVLVNPAATLKRRQPLGYTGRLLSSAEQRHLLERWTRPDIDPRERVVGLLCLLHAASNLELRHIRIDQIDLEGSRIQLGRRPQSVPLDPLTVDALTACLQQHKQLLTMNPHLLVTHQTRLHPGPCSIAFPAALLFKTGVTTQVLRQTRLADLAHRADPRLVAAAMGLTKEAVLHYIRGTVDFEALAFPSPGTSTCER